MGDRVKCKIARQWIIPNEESEIHRHAKREKERERKRERERERERDRLNIWYRLSVSVCPRHTVAHGICL